MGLSSTLIYTSELILCSTICVPSATWHNIHMYSSMSYTREIPKKFVSVVYKPKNASCSGDCCWLGGCWKIQKATEFNTLDKLLSEDLGLSVSNNPSYFSRVCAKCAFSKKMFFAFSDRYCCDVPYFDSIVQRAEDWRKKFHFCRLPFAVTVMLKREIKFDVYGKRQTAKIKLLPSVFSSLYSRIKIFVFAVNSKRHFSIFVWFI